MTSASAWRILDMSSIRAMNWIYEFSQFSVASTLGPFGRSSICPFVRLFSLPFGSFYSNGFLWPLS